MMAMGESKMLARNKMKFSEEEQEANAELLPGLPNHVTVQLICTKLPWRTFHVLSSVSRIWLGAIRSGEINDTRIRSGKVETLAFLECAFLEDPEEYAWRTGSRYAMALYSLREKAIYRLPTLVPPFERLTLNRAHRSCVTIGGRVYIFGAMDTKVWVLDVAGQKKWQECASMLTRRSAFGCTVFEGKIYVFGGYFGGHSIDFSEVYDPKVDAWTKISLGKSSRTQVHAWAFRDEILVAHGYIYDPDYNGYFGEKFWIPAETYRDGMEAYDPAKDSWRTIQPGEFPVLECLFTAHAQRLSSLPQSEIFVVDLVDKFKLEKGSLHTCFSETLSNDLYRVRYRGDFRPDQVLATNDGFLTKGYFDYEDPPLLPDDEEPPLLPCRLYQSGTIELGNGRKKILLEEVECSPLIKFFHCSFLLPIQL